MAQPPYKGKRVEVGILTDTYKIQGTLFLPLAGEGGYAARLSDFLNDPEKALLALTSILVVARPDPEMKFETPFLAPDCVKTPKILRRWEEEPYSWLILTTVITKSVSFMLQSGTTLAPFWSGAYFSHSLALNKNVVTMIRAIRE